MDLIRSIGAILWVGLQLALVIGSMLLAFVLFISTGHAQDGDSRWVYKTIRQQYRVCDWSGDCYHRWRYVQVRSYRAPVYGYIQRDHDYRDYDDRDRSRGRCLSTHKAIGNERYDKEKAKEDARQQWASIVRFHHGVVFMDLTNARDVVFTCSKSSTGERASEKAAAVLSGGTLQQCEVEAKPCRAERMQGSDER